ncbi:MAG: hydrogenase maturation nickel metallochaperone HypA [Deltaproteobacteria bacterium]|nr:hydrogenase maturation nickel metallochaperone HypA [Deltaproteobacteria bacterium]
MTMMKGIIMAVREVMRKDRLKTLTSLKIKVGELGAEETRALEFAFEVCLKEARMKPARLDIIKAPITAICSGCGKKLRVSGFHHECPSCGSNGIKDLSSAEMEIISMEAEP